MHLQVRAADLRGRCANPPHMIAFAGAELLQAVETILFHTPSARV